MLLLLSIGLFVRDEDYWSISSPRTNSAHHQLELSSKGTYEPLPDYVAVVQ